MAEHYVAVLSVYKITQPDDTGRTDDRRRKSEELKTTVKSETLEGLKTKVAGHLVLIEEVELQS